MVIPVLDFSPHGAYNILTLLDDLAPVAGEVICIFNSPEVYDRLRDHPRIDKFCFNKLNAGVSRSWNMGINLAEGRAIVIMNADLHVSAAAIEQLEELSLQPSRRGHGGAPWDAHRFQEPETPALL